MQPAPGYQVTPMPMHLSFQPAKGVQPTTGPGAPQLPPGFGATSPQPYVPLPHNPTAPGMTTIGLNQGPPTFGTTQPPQGQNMALPPGFTSAQGPAPMGQPALPPGFLAAQGPSPNPQLPPGFGAQQQPKPDVKTAFNS